MYKVNSQGSMLEEKEGTFTLLITEEMLSELEKTDLSGCWMACGILAKYFPEVFPTDYYLDKAACKKWALIHVVNASALSSDRYFMARVCFMTVETVLNNPINKFRLRFPYIEGNEP